MNSFGDANMCSGCGLSFVIILSMGSLVSSKRPMHSWQKHNGCSHYMNAHFLLSFGSTNGKQSIFMDLAKKKMRDFKRSRIYGSVQITISSKISLNSTLFDVNV